MQIEPLKPYLTRSGMHYVKELQKRNQGAITLKYLSEVTQRELEQSWLSVPSVHDFMLFQQAIKDKLCKTCGGEECILVVHVVQSCCGGFIDGSCCGNPMPSLSQCLSRHFALNARGRVGHFKTPLYI